MLSAVLLTRHAYGIIHVIEGMERSEKDFKDAYRRMVEDNVELKFLESSLKSVVPKRKKQDALSKTMSNIMNSSKNLTSKVPHLATHNICLNTHHSTHTHTHRRGQTSAGELSALTPPHPLS